LIGEKGGATGDGIRKPSSRSISDGEDGEGDIVSHFLFCNCVPK